MCGADLFKSARDSAYRNVLKKQQDLAKRPLKLIAGAAKRSLSPKKSAQERLLSKNADKIVKSEQKVEEDLQNNVYERSKPTYASKR